MGPMNRIASLKSDHATPATLAEKSARFGGVAAIIRKRRIEWTINQTDLSAQQPVALVVESTHAGMRRISRAIDEFRFSLFVVAVFVRQMEDGQQIVFLVQRHILKLPE